MGSTPNITVNDESAENIAQTLAKELKVPQVLFNHPYAQLIALPPDWTTELIDQENFQKRPRRKVAQARADDADSFIAYIRRHGSVMDCTVWIQQDPRKRELKFHGILNDHGDDEAKRGWRDHTISYVPVTSAEWDLWSGKHTKAMSQLEFAQFIEENGKDIANADGFPSGADMLAMALQFEATQDVQIKSALRLQSGAVALSYTDIENAETQLRMNVFSKFAIGIPVFFRGQAYQIEARLRYRIGNGKATFWYELVRPDVIFDDAGAEVVNKIKAGTGVPTFFGKP